MPLLLCSVCTSVPAGSEKVMGLCSVSATREWALLFNRKKNLPSSPINPQSELQSFSPLRVVFKSSVGERHFPNEHFSLWPFRCPFWWVIAFFYIYIYLFVSYVICRHHDWKHCSMWKHWQYPAWPLKFAIPKLFLLFFPLYSEVHLSEELSRGTLQWSKKRYPLHINTPLKYELEREEEKWIELNMGTWIRGWTFNETIFNRSVNDVCR